MAKLELHWDRCFADERTTEYFWCVHCRRAWHEDEVREIDGEQYCGYEDCSGSAVIDAVDWGEFVRPGRNFNAKFPEIPEKGKVYDPDDD